MASALRNVLGAKNSPETSQNIEEPEQFDRSFPDSDRSPLINSDGRVLSDEHYLLQSVEGGGVLGDSLSRSRRSLGQFSGVFSPVALSMFSTALFLRLGFVVGQSGVILAIVQFLLAYLILYLTILSICAISTNGAVEGGGAYYMISRALGPEFGGSIGVLFFLANVFSCALYISGFVEGLTDNFGPGGSMASSIPSNKYWWPYLYCSVVLGFCLLVCLVGGAMFARTSVFILLIVVACMVSVVISMFVTPSKAVPYPDANTLVPHNDTNNTYTANYTGFNLDTFMDNINSNYTVDYKTKDNMNFAAVFAVLFSSVTGIMNGANMSGELKDPSKAIPRGTLSAACFTLVSYIVLCLLTGASCTRELLIGNYNYLQNINIWPPFVVIGIFSATLSAALGNLIGASRILEALARDELFWSFLKPAKIATKGGNPIVAVLISWLLVQLVLLIGSLNAIAPMASELFMMSYAATNLACLALDLASAPNFRPTFKYFSWHTALLGFIGCLVMSFLVDPIKALIAIMACLVLTIVLHLRDFPTSWGSISQALIFHQVRKYLLLLDIRKAHVKFWRPQMLLLVSNPRAACELIDFINDLKKGGLYVLGHIKVGSLDSTDSDPCHKDFPKWQLLVDKLKVKAFVELTLASSVREGVQHLIRMSGLGGMKPNTICFGFYDSTPQQDSFSKRQGKPRRRLFYGQGGGQDEWSDLATMFPDLRQTGNTRSIMSQEYVQMISDSLKMNKNVCIFRHFQNLDKTEIFSRDKPMYIDVWPINFFQLDTANYFDNTCLFMLQLACILHMVGKWQKHSQLRVFLCVREEQEDTSRKRQKLAELLRQLRIPGQTQLVNLAAVLSTDDAEGVTDTAINSSGLTYLTKVNHLLRREMQYTALTFCYLPSVSAVQHTSYQSYLKQLEVLTESLPPTVLVHGTHPVTSTTL